MLSSIVCCPVSNHKNPNVKPHTRTLPSRRVVEFRLLCCVPFPHGTLHYRSHRPSRLRTWLSSLQASPHVQRPTHQHHGKPSHSWTSNIPINSHGFYHRVSLQSLPMSRPSSRYRSPLHTTSRLIPLSTGTKMFQFPAFKCTHEPHTPMHPHSHTNISHLPNTHLSTHVHPTTMPPCKHTHTSSMHAQYTTALR